MNALDVFLQHPSRYIDSLDGTRWHVSLVRGNAWSPPVWAYRLSSVRPKGLGDDSDVLLHPAFVLPALNVPPTLFRWATYHLQRRRDWRVVVRPATAILLRDAVLDKSYADKRSAAVQALQLIGDIRSGRLVPSAAGGFEE